jgi:Ser/Thr protein kinase RdoA (MazF antagonist)
MTANPTPPDPKPEIEIDPDVLALTEAAIHHERLRNKFMKPLAHGYATLRELEAAEQPVKSWQRAITVRLRAAEGGE